MMAPPEKKIRLARRSDFGPTISDKDENKGCRVAAGIRNDVPSQKACNAVPFRAVDISYST